MVLAEHGTFHHVYDFDVFELPFGTRIPVGVPGLTKFMLLQLVAALLVFLVFRGLANRAAGGRVVGGWFWNFWEMLAVFVRDEVVRPVIGDPHDHHEQDVGHGHQHPLAEAAHLDAQATVEHAVSGHPADRYLPFVWSCFFFILFCNLLGALPWLGSATGNAAVTLALAVTAFIATYYYGSRQFGPGGFWTNMIPAIDAPKPIKLLLVPMIFIIEVIGIFIKHCVLAIRLFANIMGGHTVLGVILGFIAAVAHHWTFGLVLPASLVGQIGISLLELLVAFIQAYVFAFLSTIFITMSVHKH